MPILFTARHGCLTDPNHHTAPKDAPKGRPAPRQGTVDAARIAKAAAQARYRATVKGRASDRRYGLSAKGRARYRRYRATLRGHLLRRIQETTPIAYLKKRLYMQEYSQC